MPVPRITKEELRQRLESADPAARPVVIDVRLKYPYEHSAVRLPGAIRVLSTSPERPGSGPRSRDRGLRLRPGRTGQLPGRG